MRRYMFIAAGGFLGAIARYLIKNLAWFQELAEFPGGTLAVNLIGAFAIGVILTYALEVAEMDVDLRIGIVTGFLGAFTTFSTLTKDAFFLLQGGRWFLASVYGVGSPLLGLLAAFLGIGLVRRRFLKGILFREEKEA